MSTSGVSVIRLRAGLLDSVRSSGSGVADVFLGACDGDHARARVAALEIVYRDTDRLHALRWPPVLDALLLGATLEDISEAMAEAPEWIAEKIVDWADLEEIEGRMTQDQGDALRELLHAAGGPAPTQPHPMPADDVAIIAGVVWVRTAGESRGHQCPDG